MPCTTMKYRILLVISIVISTYHVAHTKPIVTEYENGTDTSFDSEQRLKYPWFGHLPDDICGATLITPRHVLTAAHCVKYLQTPMEAMFEFTSDENSVKFKSVDSCVPSQFVEKYRISNVKIHPEFSWRNGDDYGNTHDIAIITLEKEVTGIEPIVLPADGSPIVHESNALLIGFGETKSKKLYGRPSMPPCHLQQASVDIFSREECMQQTNVTFTTKLTLYLGNNLLCAGRMEGGVGSCNGDSGGPLFIQKNGQYIIRGVVSYGDGCGQKNQPTLYMNVAYYLPWIKQVAPGIKQEGPQLHHLQ